MRIPYIARWPEDGRIHAAFALTLSSIESGAILNTSPEFSRWRETHQRNVRLINVIAHWQHPISCELHILSEPSLLSDVPAHNEIKMVWHVCASDENIATELALSDSFRLETLLNTFWPMSGWLCVQEEGYLDAITPFLPRSCLSVCHRKELISSTQPFAEEKMNIGFRESSRDEAKECVPTVLEHVYPWIPSVGEDLSSLMESLLCLPSPRWIIVRLSNEGKSPNRTRAMRRLEDAVSTCERLLSGLESKQITISCQAQAIRTVSINRHAQLSDGALRGSVLLLSPGEPDFALANILGQCITGDHARRQVENPLEGGFAVKEVDSALYGRAFEFPEGEPWTVEESACAFRLPLLDHRQNLGLRVQRHRTVELQPASNVGSSMHTILGINLHRGVSRNIETEVEDRLHHALYIGATGTGKSSSLLSNMLQDARAGIGFTLIDPPGELADDLLARFPKERADDLIIVDLEDSMRPVPMNFLAWSTPEERDLIIDTLYSTLLQIYKSPDFFGPVFEQYFRSGLRLLLGDRPNSSDLAPTLLDFPQILRNREFRAHLKSNIEDTEILDAIEEGEKVHGDSSYSNIAPYITSKLGRFLHNAQLRRIVGHGSMAINFREAMDSGKIIIFKLAQGRVGRNAAGILLAQIVARFRLAAMSRANIPQADRKPYFLYIDECQVLADANIADMLSQCRKYSLGLVLANQYVSQLRESGVLGAVFGNVGTIAAFRVSAEDARLLESVFSPSVNAQDLVECPNWCGYMRLYSSRTPRPPFSFTTLPPFGMQPDLAWACDLKERSRQQWGVPQEEIDERIAARRRAIKELSCS